MVGGHPEVCARITKPLIFTLNFITLDDSYPKRLWRLCKNYTLKYDKKYWANCYELRDGLHSYLNNSYQTSGDVRHQAPGDPVSQAQYLQRFEENLIEYNKVVDLVRIAKS